MYYQRRYGIPLCIVALAIVYGPRQDASGEGGVVAILRSQLLKGEMPTIHGSGNQTRDLYMWVM